jgi:hypothetical protein
MSDRTPRQLFCNAWLEITSGFRALWTLWFARPLSTSFGLVLLVSKILLVVLLIWIVFQNSFREIHWSYVVEAETRGAEIVFTGNSNAWRLDEAVRCLKRDTPLRAAPRSDQRQSPLCDPRAYAETDPSTVTIQWRAGDRITARTDETGSLEIRLAAAKEAEKHKTSADAVLAKTGLEIRADGETETLKSGDLLILKPEGWARSGALTFSGRLVIGAEMSSGQAAYLLGGRYEVRDSGVQSWLASEEVHTILKGDLSRGERVRVVSVGDDREERGTATSFGHITMRDEDVGKVGFQVTMASQNGDTALEIRRDSRTEPSYVRPDWIDTLDTSPLLIGLIALVTVFANLAQIPPFGSRG